MASVSVVRMVITALPDVDCRHVKHTGSSLYSRFALKCEEWYDGDMLSRLFLLGDVTSQLSPSWMSVVEFGDKDFISIPEGSIVIVKNIVM